MTLALGGRSDFGTTSQQCKARSLDISRSMAAFPGGDGLFIGERFAVHELDFLGSIVEGSVKCVGEGGADFSLIVERRTREDVLESFIAEDLLVIVVVENVVGVGGIVVTSDLAVM